MKAKPVFLILVLSSLCLSLASITLAQDGGTGTLATPTYNIYLPYLSLIIPTSTPTPTPTNTPTVTPTPTDTPTVTNTPTMTASPSPTIRPTGTPKSLQGGLGRAYLAEHIFFYGSIENDQKVNAVNPVISFRTLDGLKQIDITSELEILPAGEHVCFRGLLEKSGERNGFAQNLVNNFYSTTAVNPKLTVITHTMQYNRETLTITASVTVRNDHPFTAEFSKVVLGPIKTGQVALDCYGHPLYNLAPGEEAYVQKVFKPFLGWGFSAPKKLRIWTEIRSHR